MKILETIPVESWSVEHTCFCCDSRLSIETNDLNYYCNDRAPE